MRQSILALIINLVILVPQALAQSFDSLNIKSGYMLIINDSSLLIERDTLILLPAGIRYRVKKSRIKKSNDFYDSLKAKSGKFWFTKELYNALTIQAKVYEDTLDFNRSTQWFTDYEGFRIRNIRFLKVEILSGNVSDTLQFTNSDIIAGLNSIKAGTKKIVLRNNMIVKTGQLIDPGTLADNERILRELPFIEDARIYLKPISGTHQVEVIVVTKDVFSLGFSPSITSSETIPGSTVYGLRVFDRNFLGLGTEMSHEYRYESKGEPSSGYNGVFAINNISGSFISARIEYVNMPHNEGWIFESQREFLTPSTKMAGGLLLESKSDDWLLSKPDTVIFIPFTKDGLDVWYGYSPVNTFERFKRNQLIIAGRYIKEQFDDRPEIAADTNQMFSNKKTFLTSLTFRRIDFLKSQMVFGFGRTEDLPVGFSLRATVGYRIDELENKPYIGLRLAQARQYPFGYLSFTGDFGGFLSADRASLQEGALNLDADFFSNLIRMRRYSFRQFFNIGYVQGINMPYYRRVDIRDDISSINSIQYDGPAKTNVHLEPVIYTPWYILGFRFVFSALFDLGYVTVNKPLIKQSNLYSRVGMEIRLRNESLVFNTIKFSINYFVRNPENNNGLRMNLSLTNPSIFNPIDQGKPEFVQFEGSN